MGLECCSPVDLPSNLQKEPIARTSALTPVRQYVMTLHTRQRSGMILVSRPVCVCGCDYSTDNGGNSRGAPPAGVSVERIWSQILAQFDSFVL